MAVPGEGGLSPAVSDFHTAFPSTTLFHTHTHPTAPGALSCSSNHIVALLTPSLITFQPLSNLTPPASFPPSTASSLALPLPPTTTFPLLTFPAPPHVPHPTAHSASASASDFSSAAARTLRVLQLDVDSLPAQPPHNHFLRGKWADGGSGQYGLYGVVMTRGNAHLVQVSSQSTLCQARILCNLSSLLVEQSTARAEPVDDWLVRLRSVSTTAIAFSTPFSSALIHQPSSPSHPLSSLLVAVGTKDGRISLHVLPAAASSVAAVVPVLVGSYVASSEYITELSFAPSTTNLPTINSTSLTFHSAVGDSSGVTTVWELQIGASGVAATRLHTFMPTIPHAPVSFLTWHRPPQPAAAGHSSADGGGCGACTQPEQRSDKSYVILAVAAASSVSIHYFQLPSLAVCSSYPLPAVHNHHISSLILTSSPTCPLPVLLSSSASSASYRHLLTPTAAIHHSHYHQPTLLSPLPARYGLAMTADGLLLVGCDVRMAETRSLKRREGLYLVSVKCWPVSGLVGSGQQKNGVARVERNQKKRKRRHGELARQKQRETEEEKAQRWTQQHRLLDEFSALCDALSATSVPRCHFSLCLYLTSRLSPLSHLLACAISEPPAFNPYTSVAHIRFVDALAAWLDVQLPLVLSESLRWSSVQTRLRTLHFLAMFALRCTSGDCQFVELTDDEKVRVVHCRDQLEAVLFTRHFSPQLSSAPPTTVALITKALTLLTHHHPTEPPQWTSSSNEAEAAMERCFVCDAGMPFESLRWVQCMSGHRWCRDADKLCAMAGVSYVECLQCGGRAECVNAGDGSGGGGTDSCCWMCGVVRVRAEV